MASYSSMTRQKRDLSGSKSNITRSNGSPTKKRLRTPPPQVEPISSNELQSPASNSDSYQRFVLTDPIAFRYLEQDASTTVLERRQELRGYECYLVEQWTTSRIHPTFVITTYTGDASHVVVVGVLSVPTDESSWSPRLRVYFKALNQYHARRKDTALGVIMVTNLSSFPSSLTVIPVPDGDLRKHRFDYFVNENLKRLGCSGRSGLTLAQPAPATMAKYLHLYKTSEKIDIYHSVIELVKLCQSALMMFAKLEIDYADGLLCDVTEQAIGDWWIDIGSDFYDFEPHDGILGPSTVAGLLGLFMGARNRLHSVGAPVAKDPFDVDAMKRGISVFQKQQRIPRTRRLDHHTLDVLHKLTQKAANKERWAVSRVVKSTVAELSSKGGELMLDAIAHRDRAGIADIETVDIDRFVHLIFGERCRWLWEGKAIKKPRGNDRSERALNDAREPSAPRRSLVFKHDEHGGFTWASGRKSTVDGLSEMKDDDERQIDPQDDLTPADRADDSSDEGIKATVLKRASALRHEAKSGLGKVKGAVGLRGHRSKPSTDMSLHTSAGDLDYTSSYRKGHESAAGTNTGPSSPDIRPIDWRPSDLAFEQSPISMQDGEGRRFSIDHQIHQRTTLSKHSRDTLPQFDFPAKRSDVHSGTGASSQLYVPSTAIRSGSATAEPSVAGSVYNDNDNSEPLPLSLPNAASTTHNLLHRSTSLSETRNPIPLSVLSDKMPRHLSFSLAEDSVLTWTPLQEPSEDLTSTSPNYRDLLAAQESLLLHTSALSTQITSLSTCTHPWTQSQLTALQSILSQASQDQETLLSLHQPLEQHLATLREQTAAALREGHEQLDGGVQETETLAARLRYEINELRSKVEDVEVGVADFEKGVARIEERVLELETEGEADGRWLCVVC
jgi:hypothetical protein